MDGFVDAGIIPDDDEKHIEIHLLSSTKGEAGLDFTFTKAPLPQE
jgi:hypothetical protein